MKKKKKRRILFINQKNILPLQPILKAIGTLAEWLGAGLQNRRRRFESARYLKIKNPTLLVQCWIFLLLTFSVCLCFFFVRRPDRYRPQLSLF